MIKPIRSFRAENGVALITVLLMTTLVMGLIVMALTNGMVGNVVSNTSLQLQQFNDCGIGNLDTAEAFLVKLVDKQESGLKELKAETDLSVDAAIVNEIQEDDTLVLKTDQLEALNTGDIVDTDITIREETATTTVGHRDCTTTVDIDKLYMIERAGGGGNVEQTSAGYHPLTQGGACDNGNIYSVTTEANNAQTGMSARFRSAYYDCPG